MDKWNFIKYFYKIKFNYPPYVVDLLAAIEIVRLSCLGYSNKRISHRLHLNVDYTEAVLWEFLKFTGWHDDLLFSPIAIYKEAQELDKYRGLVYNIDIFSDEKIVNISYNICKQYYKLKEIVDNYN